MVLLAKFIISAISLVVFPCLIRFVTWSSVGENFINLEDKSFWGHFLDLFIHPIQSFIALINLESESTVPLAYETQDYNNFYASVQGGKTINAILEQKVTPEFLVADYRDFDQDICIAIEAYDDSKFPDIDAISCNETEDNTYQVYSKEYSALTLWKDLTAKLRII